MKTTCSPRLSPQMALWQSHTFGHIRLCTSCAQVHELSQSHCGDNRGGRGWYTVFMIKYIIDPSCFCEI